MAKRKNTEISTEVVECVDAEIVDRTPLSQTPVIKLATPNELDGKNIKAPPLEELFPRHPGGRRKKYQTPEEMKVVIDDYFANCIRAVVNEYSGETEYVWVDPPTVPGLARALGLTMKTVLEYQKLDEYVDIITDAKLIIEEYTAKALHNNPKATGLIFVLKNMGWQDNRVVTYAPPNRLEAAQTPEQIAELINQDIVD